MSPQPSPDDGIAVHREQTAQALRGHADDLLTAAGKADDQGGLITLVPEDARKLAGILFAAAMLVCV
jgi:hypothetical protein